MSSQNEMEGLRNILSIVQVDKGGLAKELTEKVR